MGLVPRLLEAAKHILLRTTADPATLQVAAAQCAGIETLSDAHGQADYRQSRAVALVRRAVMLAY